jgi:phage terminase small subunit
VIPLKEKLNVKQEKFVQNIVSGMSQRQAYKDAFKVDYDENAIDSNASTLFKQAKIQQRYKELIEELKEATIMTAKERMIWLSEVVQGIQKEKEAVFTDGDVVIKDVEANLNTKIKALDTLNKMSGEYITKVEADVSSEVVINIELSDD